MYSWCNSFVSKDLNTKPKTVNRERVKEKEITLFHLFKKFLRNSDAAEVAVEVEAS